MRRRTLLLALPIAGLGACSTNPPAANEPPAVPGTPDPNSSAPGSSGHSGPGPAPDPAPTLLGKRAELVDPATVRLTLEMTVMIVVDPGWNTAPQELDGIFLGVDDSGEHLRFTALDQDGTALWTAQRLQGHARFALSRDDEGRALAVLTDLTPGDGDEPLLTATGYDLRTAEVRWGPVPLPGALLTPGLLVAAEPQGPRAVLSASTGEVLLRDEDLAGGRLVAEHCGLVLLTDGDQMVARSGDELTERWRMPLPEGLDPSAARILGRIDSTTDLAVLGGGEQPGILLDLAEGRVVATGVTAAAYDHGLDVTVVAAGGTVRGLGQDGQERWRHQDPEQLVFLSAGERLAYAQRPEEGTLVVLETSQGMMVQPYDVDLSGPLAVPELFSADAATSVYVEQKRYLVTTTLDQAYGLRE